MISGHARDAKLQGYFHATLQQYLLPVPIIYVFVPCKVICPGLHPNTLMILLESLVTTGITAAIVMLCTEQVTRLTSLDY